MTLQLALLLVGALLIIGVIMITKWTDWASKLKSKSKQIQSRRQPISAEPPLLTDRIDDPDGKKKSLSKAQPNSSQTRSKTRAHDDQSKNDQQEVLSNHQESSDPKKSESPFVNLRQIDYWVKLTGRMRRSGEEWSRLVREDLKQCKAEVAIHGLSLPDLEWRDLTVDITDVEFKDIVIAIQLVNEGEALAPAELAKFEAWVKRLADETQSETYFVASIAEAVTQAKELQAFIEQCEGALEIAVTCPDEAGFSGRLIETSAKQLGLNRDEGRMIRSKEMGNKMPNVLYEVVQLNGVPFPDDMSSDVVIHAVKFRMIPALTQKPAQAVKEMLDAVKVFKVRVVGEIKIPGFESYHPSQMTDLVSHLSQLEQKMVDAGVEPGGAQAVRIF